MTMSDSIYIFTQVLIRSCVNGKGNRGEEWVKKTDISGNDRWWRLDKGELYGNKIILDCIFWKWKVP